MDVALDANELLSDPRMQSVRFQTLLSYLRKTDSKLLIPRVVWDEIVARYPDRIRESHRKAAEAMKTLSSLALSLKTPRLGELRIEREVKALKRKLRKPSASVGSRVIANYKDASLQEVVRRGIDRLPPANPKGEELRDVVIWLMLLGHARKSNREIAFISHDEHFRDGEELHPFLKRDIQDSKAKLLFYKSIDEFIRAHAPPPRPLTESAAAVLYSPQTVFDLFEIEARRVFPKIWDSQDVAIRGRDISFVQGWLYDVSSASVYGEVVYKGDLQLVVSTSHYYQFVAPMQTGSFIQSFSPGIAGSYATQVSPKLFMGSNWDTTYAPLTLATGGPTGQLTMSQYPTHTKLVSQSSEALLSAELALAIRIVASKVAKIEVERFEVTDIAYPKQTQEQVPPSASTDPL